MNDFGLAVELPLDQLCPTVTSRLNYILWLEDLLNSSGETRVGEPVTKKQRLNENSDASIAERSEVFGIDIGTGKTLVPGFLIS